MIFSAHILKKEWDIYLDHLLFRDVSLRPLSCSELISMVSACTGSYFTMSKVTPSATFQRKLRYLIIQPPPPQKSIKTKFHRFKKKNCRLPIVFFETKKKPKKHRGKTKKQQQKTTTPGTSRGKKTQRVQRWENPMELRLTLGSFMGLSLGVTRLSLRGTLFLAFRHLTPHLPFLGIFGAILLFFFLLGKREKT